MGMHHIRAQAAAQRTNRSPLFQIASISHVNGNDGNPSRFERIYERMLRVVWRKYQRNCNLLANSRRAGRQLAEDALQASEVRRRCEMQYA